MPSNVRDVRFIISSFACPTSDPVSSHHPLHPLIRWAITTPLPLVTLNLPLYGNQCPATDHTSKQTQCNASLQVVYSFSVRLVTGHWSWSYNESDAWQDSSSANCQHHLMLLRNNPTPLKYHPWSVANCTASWMTAILQILQHHNLVHHTMNYNVIIMHRASRSRTIHSGTGECMLRFCHCLHNSRCRRAPLSVGGGGILQTRALQIIRQNIWGAYMHQKQWLLAETIEFYC